MAVSASSSQAPSRLGLLRQADYRNLWIAETISLFGTHINTWFGALSMAVAR